MPPAGSNLKEITLQRKWTRTMSSKMLVFPTLSLAAQTRLIFGNYPLLVHHLHLLGSPCQQCKAPALQAGETRGRSVGEPLK